MKGNFGSYCGYILHNQNKTNTNFIVSKVREVE